MTNLKTDIDSERAAGRLLAAIAMILVVPAGMIWSGYALTILWAWFVVGAFAVPALTVAQAIGLTLVVRFITWQNEKKDQDEEGAEPYEKLAKTVMFAIAKPAVCLAVGWVIKQWLPS